MTPESSAPTEKWMVQVGLSKERYCPGRVCAHRVTQDLGSTLSFAFSASVPVHSEPSPQGNQHCKGTVRGLNGKMDLPTKATKVQAGELSLQKCPWPLSTENTALVGTETGPQQNLTITRPNTFQKARHLGLPQAHPDPLPSSEDTVPPGIEFLDLWTPKFTAFL